jgi:ribosomal protein L40E
MVKICSNCGAENSDDAFWCINCDSRFLNKDINEIKKQQDIEQTFVERKKSNTDNRPKNFIDSSGPTQYQNHAPFDYNIRSNIGKKELRKSRFKLSKVTLLFILLFAIIFLVTIYVGFNHLNSDEQKFISTWNSSTSNTGDLTFESGFFSKKVIVSKSGSNPIEGSWRCENGKLYMEWTLGDVFDVKSTHFYEFQGDQIVLTHCDNGEQRILTRK